MGRPANWIKDLEKECKDMKSMTPRTNPYTGEAVKLPVTAAAIYDTIKGAEFMGEYEVVRQGLDWFINNHPEEYMTLLD